MELYICNPHILHSRFGPIIVSLKLASFLGVTAV